MVIAYLQAVRQFNRNVCLCLVAAGLIGFTIFGGIYSLLFNLYLLRLGYGPEFIGWIHAVGMLAWAAFCLPAGALGRRWGSRRTMIAGMGLAAVGYGLVPLAELVSGVQSGPYGLQSGPHGLWQSAWLTLAYLFGNLTIALYDVNVGPFLMGATSPQERDHVFSVQGALWPLAGFAGSLLGGLLPAFFANLLSVSTDHPAPYRYPLLIAAASLIPATLALLATRELADPPTLALTHRGPSAPGHSAETAAASPSAALRMQLNVAPFGLIAFLGFVVWLQGTGEGAARTFFNAYLDVVLRVPTAQIGVLTAAGQLLAVPAALAMPLVAARWGRRRIVIWGSLGMALSLLPLALIPRWGVAGLGYMGMIALASIVRPAFGVYLMEAVAPEWRPAMSGATTMALGLSWAAISLGGGYMIAALGYPALFLAGAGLTAVGVLVFRVYSR